MTDPDSHIQQAMASPQASASQSGGGGAGGTYTDGQNLNTIMNKSLDEKVGKGFDNQIAKGVGNNNLVEELGQSPLTAAGFGKVEGSGLNNVNMNNAPKIDGNVGLPDANLLTKGQGQQGQGH